MLVAHISDLHLGAKSPGDAHGAARLNSLRQCLTTLAACRPEVLLVAGDVFDNPQVDRAVIDEAARSFDAIRLEAQPLPVLVIPGNHDSADADRLWSTFEHSLGPTSAVRVIRRPEIVELAAGKLLVECYPCLTRYSAEPPWEKRLPLPANKGALRVVVAHGTLQGDQVPQAESDAYPFVQADLDALSADYVALGHFHGVYPAWPEAEECERAASYSGTHEPDQFTGDAGYALLATLEYGRPTRLRRIKVGKRQWRTLELTAPADLPELEKLREEIVAAQEASQFVIRLKVGGSRWTAAHIEQLERLEGSMRSVGAHVERRGDPTAQLDMDGFNCSRLPSGALKEALADLHAEWLRTADEREREVLSAALQLGWEAIQEAGQP
jgi:DNA repair exonuclease SbcCD nuclease subunit